MPRKCAAAPSSDRAVVLGWTILGLVALLTAFLLIGGLAGPHTHVSAARMAITAGVIGAEFLVGLALVRRWRYSRPLGIAVALVGAVACGIAAVRLFADPGPPGPEGGPYQAAFGLALLVVFQASVAIVLIADPRK
jgi:nitrate/nitrite transporter NarK